MNTKTQHRETWRASSASRGRRRSRWSTVRDSASGSRPWRASSASGNLSNEVAEVGKFKDRIATLEGQVSDEMWRADRHPGRAGGFRQGDGHPWPGEGDVDSVAASPSSPRPRSPRCGRSEKSRTRTSSGTSRTSSARTRRSRSRSPQRTPSCIGSSDPDAEVDADHGQGRDERHPGGASSAASWTPRSATSNSSTGEAPTSSSTPCGCGGRTPPGWPGSPPGRCRSRSSGRWPTSATATWPRSCSCRSTWTRRRTTTRRSPCSGPT